MKAKDLKSSILQMAVEGKLVPQDPADEPVSVLLERIREEKHKLIAKGKAKFPKGGESVIYIGSDGSPYEKRVDAKGRVLSEKCIADEMPYDELPEGWAWARLETALVNRDSERIPVSVADRERLAKIYDYYGASGAIDKVDRYLFDKPLLLIGEDGANLLMRSKPIAFLARGKYWVNNHAHVLDGISERYLEYVALFINSISLAPYVTGTAQPKMNQAKMGSIVIPIPPESEQTRILIKVSELMPLVEEYGRLEDAREALDAALPGRLRKSVLQMAVQGKLVPQDPAEEPADALLERIREQRRELVKQKKMKVPKGGESVIFAGSDGRRYEKRVDAKGRESEPVCIEDEIPFEVPNNWEWARLESVADIINGFTPKRSEAQFWDNGKVPWFTASDIRTQGRIISKTEQTITSLAMGKRRTCPPDTVLICCTASVGEAVLTKIPLVTNQQFNSLVQFEEDECRLVPQYLLLWSLTVKHQLVKTAGTTTIPFVSVAKLGKLLIPVPSTAEQHRIVERVNKLMPLITSQ